jgi:RNA polymerase sigma-70 factor (ECF subfamily)
MTDLPDRLYERVLVLRCQAGDETAFAELVQRYHPRLHYYVRKLLGDATGVEDVLQDVWFDAFRGLPRLAEPTALASWLYRIARDRVFRLLRKRRLPECSMRDVDVADPSAEEEPFAAEDAARIHAALDRLPADQREVLVLRFLEEMNYEDIARITDTRLGTVRSRLHYAKRALRALLEGVPKKRGRDL